MTATQVNSPNTSAPKQHKERKHLSERLLGIWAVLVYIFLFIPIVIIFIYSFNTGRLLVSFQEFGLDSFTAILHKKTLSNAVAVSLQVGVISAIVATALGSLAGIALARKPGKWAGVFIVFLLLVAVTPEIVDAVALLPWFVFLGQDLGLSIFNNGIVRLVVSHSIFSMAVVTYSVRARLVGVPANLEEASADLYATPFQTFRKVTLPLAMPAILAGLLLSFTFSLDDAVIANFVQVSGSTPWPVYILSALKSGLRPEVAAVSTLLLALTLVALAVVALVLKRSGDSAVDIAKTVTGG